MNQIRTQDECIKVQRTSMWQIGWLLLPLMPMLALGWYKTKHAAIHAFDTGIYLQILQNLWRNGSWASSIVGESNFLAHHFQPIIITLLPAFLSIKTAFALFLVSGICVVFTCILLFRRYQSTIPLPLLMSSLVALVLHPSISSRLSHSFVPEIIALPFLTFGTICLDIKAMPKGQPWVLFATLTMIFCGLTKETLWPVLAWACLIYGINTPKMRTLALGWSALWLSIFIFLFMYWMPRHTSLPNYYGLRYYRALAKGPPQSILDWTEILFKNFFSLGSMKTLFVRIFAIPLFIPLLGPARVLLGAIPGIFLILCASEPIVHHPGNQYQLLVIPFLWVAMLSAFENRFFLRSKLAIRWIPWALVALPLIFYHLDMDLGALKAIENSPGSAYIQQDLLKVRAELLLDKSAQLIVDANLQPLLSDFQNLKVLLPFVGNPVHMTKDSYTHATFILTMVDVRSIDCRTIKPSITDGSEFDYDGFYQYCSVIQDLQPLTIAYHQSGLIVYDMNHK